MAVQQITKSSFRFSTLLAVLMLVAVMGGVFYMLLPTKDSFDKNAASLIQKQNQLSSLKIKLSELEALKTSFSGSEVMQKDITNLIPTGVQQDKVIELLAKAADDNEVSLNSLSFGVAQGRELEANVITVTMNLGGAHTDLIRFLESLETASRKLMIKSISVQTLENRLENMSINLEAYYI